MVVEQRYDVISAEGELDRRVFSDSNIYQEELERIFGRAWLLVGHESLISNPNDFLLGYMGEDPVILTRDSKSNIHAFLNMCRHRGNRVVRADDGNAKNFMCTYHGWTFSNEGKLVSVPGLQEAYYGELDVEHLGLVEARVDTYAGLIFATWAEDAPSLEAYLGDMRWYLDIRYNHRDTGVQAIGPVKWIMPANWKIGVDNASGDTYHGQTSHISASLVRAQFKRGRFVPVKDRFVEPARQSHAGNGHGMTATISSDENEIIRTRLNQSQNRGAMADWNLKTLPEVERRLGSYRARQVRPQNFAVFPNFFLGMRMSHPRGPYVTEVWSFETYDKDASPEVKASVREQSVHGAGHLGGLMMQDDMDNWRNVTEAGKSSRARGYAANLTMGIRHEGTAQDRPGIAVCHATFAEVTQRAYYARWQEFMNANSWKDIHLDPITAKFEGTATFHG